MQHDLANSEVGVLPSIETPALGKTGPDCKITLAYRHTKPRNREDLALLRIELFYPGVYWGGHLSKTLRDIEDYTEDWKNYTVHVGQLDKPGYWIRMTGQSKIVFGMYRNLEVDNIRFVNCDPTAPLDAQSLDCDFENGTCGWFDWDMDVDKQIDWVTRL